MEVLTPPPDGSALSCVDRREEEFEAKHPTRLKRSTLLKGRDVFSAREALMRGFAPAYPLYPDTEDPDAVLASAQTSSVHRDINSPSSVSISSRGEDTGSTGRDTERSGHASSEHRTGIVDCDDAALLSARPQDSHSSRPGGPMSLSTSKPDDLQPTAGHADIVEGKDDEACVQQSWEQRGSGQRGSADDRQDAVLDTERSMQVDNTWTDSAHLTQDSRSAQHPPQFPEDALEADDKPLIGNEAAEDENEAAKDNQAIEADQENIDPNNMPLSSLFKTTKGKKSKSKKSKNKDKDVTDTHAIDDVTSKQDAQAEEETPTTTATPQASDVTETSLSNDVAKAEEIDLAEKVEGVQEGKEDDVTVEQAPVSSTDIKMDETAEGEDSAVTLDTTTTTPPDDLALREGPQLSPSEGGTVETQPAKADGSLPPESAGREKQSLLHDHNPEGMVCCVIL